jgi:hypothetical protein
MKTLGVVFSVLVIASLARDSAAKVQWGVLNVSTVAHVGGQQGRYLPNVVVRYFDKKTGRETLSMSNKEGIDYVVLRPGHYCFEAFTKSGHKLQLFRDQPSCFDLRRGEELEVGVVIEEAQP